MSRTELQTRQTIERVLLGAELPSSTAEWRRLVTFCVSFRQHVTEAALWRIALAQDPPPFDDTAGRDLVHAARSVLRSLAGVGIEKLTVDTDLEALRLSEAARWFLEGTSTFFDAHSKSNISTREAKRQAAHWSRDPDFAALRPGVNSRIASSQALATAWARLAALADPTSRPVSGD